MIDALGAQLALRNRARVLIVCTTGSMSLSATATGYARAAGSFVTDGFLVGMEVTPAGFAIEGNNAAGVLTAVTATALTIKGGRSAETAAIGRIINVGLPALRSWENKSFTPIAGRPYIEEDFVPATSEQISAPFNGGTLEETGLYTLRWYGLSDTGVGAIRKSIGALLALFTPGTAFAVGSASLRIPGDEQAPYASQLEPIAGGWTAVEVLIPWYAWSVNTVTA